MPLSTVEILAKLCVWNREVSPCLYKHPKGLVMWWGALHPTWAILQV